MTLSLEHVTFNTTDARALAGWWAGVLGGEVVDVHDGWFVKVVLGSAPGLAMQRVEEPTPGVRRLHLDLTCDDLDSETERLVAAGAGLVQRHGEPGGFRWTVFTDPDGNEFCVTSGG